MTKHTPVLLKPVIEALNIQSGNKYIDATAGEGGYTQAVLEKKGQVLAIDWDAKQIEKLKNKDLADLKAIHGNFANIAEIAKENNFIPVDGIVFDLGLSMTQLWDSERGFSFKKDNQRLDMRIDTNEDLTAEKIITSYSQEQLYETFIRGSEELNSRAISRAIFSTRKIKDIKTVKDLKDIIDKVLGENLKQKEKVYARIFQALRIEVNQEFKNLKKALKEAIKITKPEGKIVAITFHSLEDRIVKLFAKENNLQIEKIRIDKKSLADYEKSAQLRILKNR